MKKTFEEYNCAMDQLRFSEAAKERMAQRLAETQKPAKKRSGWKSVRMLAIAAAAVLVLTVAAGATGALKTAGEAFSAVFGADAAETEIIDRIGRPIGASATDNGVTVTADAILGDKYHYGITFTIAKDDGTVFDVDFDSIQGTNRLPLQFKESDVTVSGFRGGSHGGSYFYDADPTDNAIQYIVLRAMDGEVPHKTAHVTMEDLWLYTAEEKTLLAEGTWELSFEMEFEDMSAELPAGQTFELNGMDAVIDAVTLSPIALRVDYTVAGEIQWSNAESGRLPEEDRAQNEKYFEDLVIIVHKSDGTSIDLSNAGGSIKKGDGETVCQKGDMFEEVIPLEEIVSITVGSIEIPME